MDLKGKHMKVGSEAVAAATKKVCRNATLAATACLLSATLSLGLAALTGCKKTSDSAAEAPQNLPVTTVNADQVKVDNPNRFPLVYASTKDVVSKLEVTGSVSPDISKELPVLSLANGRIVALHVELGDYVKKGQLVMDVQSPDVANAFSTYLQSVSNEHLAKVTLDRDKLLISKGAIPQSQVDAAVNGEEIAVAALNASEQQLKIYGVDKDHPSDTVHIYSPTSGVVVAQNVTNAAAAGITYAGNAGSLTIADLSHVWVVVDVYENDLAQVHIGQHVDIRISAFPNQVFDGTISDIGATLDPSIRTAKVRIVVNNPHSELRIGMFATGTILGSNAASKTTVPADAILHLHDAAFVYRPTGRPGIFERVQVKTGETLPGNVVVIDGGIAAGQQIVANALDLQNTADNQ
jgi:cobalt-zinc-cadmium efflux system membrane fusion protein